MRILASNPDTIGDMVLRQPLYGALLRAGHQLLLIVRPSVEPLIPLIAPGAGTIILPREVYGGVDEHWADFAPVVAAARDWKPDLLLITPYQWTRFEERLAAALRDLPNLVVAGMNGSLYPGDPFLGDGPKSELVRDLTATLDEDLPEAEKNAALAELLGAPVLSADPVFPLRRYSGGGLGSGPIGSDEIEGMKDEGTNEAVPASSSTSSVILHPSDLRAGPLPNPPPEYRGRESEARLILHDRELEIGGFWLACVTGTAHVPIKAWPAERWAEVLCEWAGRYGRRFLFVGLPEEREIVERVQAAMGDAAGFTKVWMEPDGSVQTLVALTALSQGYVGHDTGPMHIAAAVGKPVLAIFGGGHRLRFLPRVSPSVSLTVRVPCAGCGWACSFDKAHCVQAMEVREVLAAVDDLEAGRVSGREARLQALPPAVHDHMTRFAAGAARDRLRRTGTLTKALAAISTGGIAQLQSERDAATEQTHILTTEAATLAREIRRLQEGMASLTDEAAGLVEQVEEREATIAELRAEIIASDGRTVAEAEGRRRDIEMLRGDAAGLQQTIEMLKRQAEQPKLVEPPAAAAPVAVPVVRKNLRERLVDLVCGTRHYVPRRPPRPMPAITLVTRILAADDEAAIRTTIDSVLGERYPHLQYILAAEDLSHSVANTYRDRVSTVVEQSNSPFAAVADVFAGSTADLVAWLDVGQSCEPGALMRIGEYFRDHSFAMAATFGQTSEKLGWRFAEELPPLDVNALRNPAGDREIRWAIFRREACRLLGPLDAAKGYAAGWDLKIRFARRFGIRRGRGHGVCTHWPMSEVAEAVPPEVAADFATASTAFERSFGPAGRARCAVASIFKRIARLPSLRHTLLPSRDWSSVPAADGFRPPLIGDEQTPVSPITHQRPDRLLFSAADSTTGDRQLHLAYYDSIGDVATAFPPIDRGELERLHGERARLTGSAVVRAANVGLSPFAHHSAGPAWVRWLGSVPCPYWRIAGEQPGKFVTAGMWINLAAPAFSVQDARVRVLVAGSHDGVVLDELKKSTTWRIAGVEAHADSIAASRAKGHDVWQCSPQDAFMTLPDGEMFDLVIIPAMLEHWADPVWAVRRLARLLVPGGRMLVRTPNLDSRLLDLFGPTWWHWQLPYHRTLFGRRGLRRLAQSCGLRVAKLRTRTDAYTAAASVQLNAIGLAGTTPPGVTFSPENSARGSKLAGWARMLWDRRGRGDELWAAFEAL